MFWSEMGYSELVQRLFEQWHFFLWTPYYRHEPLMCLLDPRVIAVLTLWHPPMKSFLPQKYDTIYSNYVVTINIAITSELVKYVRLLPGMVTVLFDGVAVNWKSKVRWLLTSSYDFLHYSLPSFFRFCTQCRRVLSQCYFLNGATLAATFMPQMQK